MSTMTAPENREHALEVARSSSDHFEAVKALSEAALSKASEDRVKAIREAMRVAPVKDVAEAVGVSVQRLYQITKVKK